MDKEQRSAAIGADAVQQGVTNDIRYETSVVDIHGFGRAPNVLPVIERPAHDERTCSDPACPHSSHGLSTAGENFDLRERAGQRYDGERMHVEGMRSAKDIAYVPEISKGGADAIDAIDHDPDACPAPQIYEGGPIPKNRVLVDGYLVCVICNRVSDATLQREIKVQSGSGGGSRRPKGKSGTKVCDVAGCGLTLCEHIAEKKSKRFGKGKPGPQRKPHGRRNPVAFKVSDDAKRGLKTGGADGQLINKLGVAMLNGLPYADVEAFIASKTQDAA